MVGRHTIYDFIMLPSMIILRQSVTGLHDYDRFLCLPTIDLIQFVLLIFLFINYCCYLFFVALNKDNNKYITCAYLVDSIIIIQQLTKL